MHRWKVLKGLKGVNGNLQLPTFCGYPGSAMSTISHPKCLTTWFFPPLRSFVERRTCTISFTISFVYQSGLGREPRHYKNVSRYVSRYVCVFVQTWTGTRAPKIARRARAHVHNSEQFTCIFMSVIRNTIRNNSHLFAWASGIRNERRTFVISTDLLEPSRYVEPSYMTA